MPYQSLRQAYYRDSSSNRQQHNEELLAARLTAESTFRSGIVTPFGELFLAVPRELSLLNERVLRFERKIEARMRSLPRIAQGAMLRDLVVSEVVSTNDLEGVFSTRRQIHELLQLPGEERDPLGQKRFRELATMYLGLTAPNIERPTSPEDIRAIYDEVMKGEPLEEKDRPDGRLFRKDAVDVIGPGSRTVHTGLFPEASIIKAMEDMIALLNSDAIPETYSAIMGHFIFEYAHPFYDGNGRTGRYLLALYLSAPLSTITSLSLSRVIAENRGAYYRTFREAEHPLNHGELTLFVMNILGNIQMAQEEIDRVLVSKKQRLDAMGDALGEFKSSNGLSDKEVEIVNLLAQLYLFASFPEAAQDVIAAHIELGMQQSRVYTKGLEEKGVVQTVSRRPLRFRLTDATAQELGIL